MWDLLLESIKRRDIDLTPAEVDIVKSSFSHKKFKKHQFILQAGDVATHDNFVIKGLARTFRINEKGQEHVLRFAAEEWWTGDLASFLSGQPAANNVDCMEDTEVLRITYADLESLFDRVPKMNRYFRLLYQKSLIAYGNRLATNLSKPAHERYEDFIRNFPALEQRIPDHQIAAYLGITPQSLSRIRKQALTKKR